MKKKLLYAFLSISLLMFGSCEKYFTVNPKGFIPESDNFKNADDAITAIYGLYGLMQPLVDQIFLAGEAQGDLVVAARGADKYIAEICQNRVTPFNPYTDYTNFYRLIMACNHAIVKLKDLTVLDPVNYSIDKCNFNIAEIVYIRGWTYLQLVKIWGDVPYITNSITMAAQMTDIAPTARAVILDTVEKELSDNLPFMLSLVTAGLNSNDVKNLRGQFNVLSAQMLLGEVNLYTGNYTKANKLFSPLFNTNGFRMELAEYSKWETEFPMAGTNNTVAPFYTQFIDFDGSKGQKNSLIRWTNNIMGGIYALKPSSNAIKNWANAPNMLLEYQVTPAGYYINPGATTLLNPIVYNDGYPVIGGYGDYIRGNGVSYIPDGSDTLIFKYLIKSRGIRKSMLQNDPYINDDAPFFIYRDGPTLLMWGEIMNRLGKPYEAMLKVNGLSTGDLSGRGTRNRVRVAPLKIDPKGEEAVRQVDRFILEEKALEAAFEGLRWFDLVRFAERGDPSLLADLVAQKYPVNQQAAIKERLRNPNYWYFPYNQRNVDANKLLKQKPGY